MRHDIDEAPGSTPEFGADRRSRNPKFLNHLKADRNAVSDRGFIPVIDAFNGNAVVTAPEAIWPTEIVSESTFTGLNPFLTCNA
jgi:hypothetical protein